MNRYEEIFKIREYGKEAVLEARKLPNGDIEIIVGSKTDCRSVVLSRKDGATHMAIFRFAEWLERVNDQGDSID
jgi:hypothetical protein